MGTVELNRRAVIWWLRVNLRHLNFLIVLSYLKYRPTYFFPFSTSVVLCKPDFVKSWSPKQVVAQDVMFLNWVIATVKRHCSYLSGITEGDEC